MTDPDPGSTDETDGANETDGTDAESRDEDPPVAARVDAGTLRPALAAVGSLVDECRLAFGSDGLRAAAMDPATVAAVEVELDAGTFERYAGDGTVVGVDVRRLDQVVGMVGSAEAVGLTLDRESWRLRIEAGELEYVLGLYDPESVREPPEIGELAFEHTAGLALPGETLDRFVSAAGMVADHLSLGVDPDAGAFTAVAEGDTDEVRFAVNAEEAAAFSSGPAESLFSLSYLECVERAVPSGTEVRLRLGEDAPLGVEYGIADGGGRVEAFVSPRLQTV